MNQLDLFKSTLPPFYKYKSIKFYKPLFNKDQKEFKIDSLFQIQKKRETYDYLKQTQHQPFNIFFYKYPLGLFSGCYHFNFRITFKEYKVGLKPAKFSLLLNQFVLNLELFINLIKEILDNNHPLIFYENFFEDMLNEIDLKFHFLVILRPKRKKGLNTKFYIIPRGIFYIHLREQIWLALFSDWFFTFMMMSYYKNFKKYLGLIFFLLIYYVSKLIHFKLYKILNKHKIYDYEQRAFDSLGNILAINFDSYKLYCKNYLKINKYSYLFSSRSLDYLMESFLLKETVSLDELEKLKNSQFTFHICST